MEKEIPRNRLVQIVSNEWREYLFYPEMIERCESDYPCLRHGELTGVIVLLDRPECGKVVSAGKDVSGSGEFVSLGRYSEAWNMDKLHPLTQEDYEKHKYNLPNNKGEDTMKYKLIKTITGEAIQKEACKGEFEKFIQKCGFYNEIPWTKENEDYAIEQNGWIDFLLKLGFIEEVDSFEFNKNLVYIFKSGDDEYKLHEGIERDGWGFIDLMASVCHANGYFKGPKEKIMQMKKQNREFEFFECKSVKDYYLGNYKEI